MLGVISILICAAALSLASPHKSDNFSVATVTPAKASPGDQVEIVYRRPELRDRKVNLHLGFNGWGLRTSGARSEVFQARTNWYTDVPMRWDASREAFIAPITLPVEARALHFAFCWDACLSNQWDNNNKRDYGWPVEFPYIGPILTWNDDTNPTSGVVVSFEDPSLSNAWLEYWPQGKREESIRIDDQARIMHQFVISKLRSGKRYGYRVGIGTDFTSKEYSFVTHDGSSNLSFIALADLQDGGEWNAFAKIKPHLKDDSQSLFYVFAGDFPWDDNPGLWWTAFASTRELLASKVIMPVPGNHDTPTTTHNANTSSFFRYFALPTSAKGIGSYDFSVGPANFLALNSETPKDFSRGGSQYRWLEKQKQRLQQTAKNQWTFAYWHTPPWDTALRHFDEQWSFRAAARLLPRTVHWHFSGHEHMYQRMLPIGINNQVVANYGTKPGQGTGFTVLPALGAWSATGLHPRGGKIPLAYAGFEGQGAIGGNGFVRVDLKGDKGTVFTFMVANDETSESIHLVDQVEITK